MEYPTNMYLEDIQWDEYIVNIEVTIPNVTSRSTARYLFMMNIPFVEIDDNFYVERTVGTYTMAKSSKYKITITTASSLQHIKAYIIKNNIIAHITNIVCVEVDI